MSPFGATSQVLRAAVGEPSADGRGRAHHLHGAPDKAIADYNKAIEIDPRSALAYGARGSAYCARGEYDKAIADHNKAIEIDSRWACVSIACGHAYNDSVEYAKATEVGTDASALEPR